MMYIHSFTAVFEYVVADHRSLEGRTSHVLFSFSFSSCMRFWESYFVRELKKKNILVRFVEGIRNIIRSTLCCHQPHQ